MTVGMFSFKQSSCCGRKWEKRNPAWGYLPLSASQAFPSDECGPVEPNASIHTGRKPHTQGGATATWGSQGTVCSTCRLSHAQELLSVRWTFGIFSDYQKCSQAFLSVTVMARFFKCKTVFLLVSYLEKGLCSPRNKTP